ncbi:MAG: LuxR family transcriptional regulator [Acidimicrobiia bacterium]|nr:LuxR family transcriptional regulator [Acidimicrobiia bacterium]
MPTPTGHRPRTELHVPARRAQPPVELTSFIGRRAQVDELAGLVGDRRLVTVTGAGGCGKTRLAVEVLSASRDSWSDGVGWVDLSSVADPSRVGDVAAAALGVLVGPVSDPGPALSGGLSGRHLLVGFDNCEHVLDDCGELVEHLLRSCPELSVLATSREPLGVAGETVWRVPSMDERDVTALFVERAQAARSAFVADAANEEAIRTLCRRLDNIPLAVELAAAWARILAPTQIAAALDDRFRLLVGGPRRAIARQQTLIASVEWSYGLLRGDARTLLRRVAVFSGGFTLEDAEAVCSDEELALNAVLPALGRLVDTSIVVVEERAGAARYRLPETIRDYAADRLAEAGETARLRDRHLAHFLAVAETAAATLEHGDQDEVLGGLEPQHDNLRAALDWGLDAEPGHGRRLAAAMVRPWFLRGHTREAIDALRRAVDLAPEDRSALQAELLSGLALVAVPAGRMAMNVEASTRAIEIATGNDDVRTLARATAYAGYVPFYSDYPRAEAMAAAAQELGATSGEAFPVDFALLLQIVSLANQDRHDELVPLADALFARTAARHERFCGAFSRNVLLYAALFTGDVRRAIERGQEAVRIARPLRDYLTTGTVASDLAWAYGVAGQLDEARRLTDTLVRSIDAAGPDVDVVGMRVTVGKLHLWGADLDHATEWLGRAAQFEEPGRDNWTAARALPSLAAALRRLGRADEAAEAADRGAAMAERLGTPHARAESLDELAHLVAVGDPGRAEDLYHQALAIRVAHGLQTHTVDSLDALAHLASAREDHAQAVRLLAASDTARAGSGYPRPFVDRAAHAAAESALRAALGDIAYGDAQVEGAELGLAEAVAYATRSRGPRSRPSVGWASLTPTEREVVARVAEGLTNPQIADRLFVSRATVKTHLAHVFVKLDVANRAELAVLASRHVATDTDR